jgi:branched-chain amino acid transport system substrate-binding protein
MEKTDKLPPAPPSRASDTASPQPDKVPYARVGEDGVEFNGPHHSDSPTAKKIIIFGKQAATLVQSPELRATLGEAGNSRQLLPVASDQNWGAASTQLVHALMDEHALAIIALDRDAAHLAEQLALKAFVPVIALSDDRKLTSTNVPWIFRLPASTTPAQALHLIQSASANGTVSPNKLRDTLASGATINGVAFLTTGEPKTQY